MDMRDRLVLFSEMEGHHPEICKRIRQAHLEYDVSLLLLMAYSKGNIDTRRKQLEENLRKIRNGGNRNV